MSFLVLGRRIIITKGDSAEFDLEITDRVTKKVFVPGDEDKVTFTVKRHLSDKEPLIRKTLGDGILKKNGGVAIVLHPDDTAHLSCGIYKYDVELVTAAGYTDTVIPPSPFVVTREVNAYG